MGIFDKAKDLISEHEDEVEKAIDKVADVVEAKVPDQHDAKVEQAAAKAKDFVEKLDSGASTKKPS
jgi:predicted RNA binding protein with dsRBD fold (UPF0201 family)